MISHAIAYSHLFTWLVEESLNSKITLNRNSLFKYNIFNAPLLSVVRTITLKEIGIKLLKAGIEPNPGPTLNDIVIITINCNGLSNDGRLLQAIGRIKKRLKQRNAIIFLQETHNANILLLENIWTGTVNVSMGTGGSRGVITLCTKDISVIAFESDDDGRSIFTFLNIGNNNYISTANVYSPNDHVISKQFIQNTTTRWDRFTASCSDNTNGISNCFLILAGDLNCVLSPYDAQSRSWPPRERQLAESILNIVEERGLSNSDIKSPYGNNFTWNRGSVFSKIDAIFVCCTLLNAITKYNTIWDFVKSDHAAIWLEIELNRGTARGRSYPKLNGNDLKAPGAFQEVRGEIAQAISLFPNHWNPHQKLDFIKVVIRTKVLEIRARNRVSKSEVENLYQQMERFKSLTFLDENQAKEFNDLRAHIHKIEEDEAEKLRVIAGIKWREEGERSTKFFLNSANVKIARSNMEYLITENGRIDDINSILDHSMHFYKNLYTKVETNHIEDFYVNCPQLSSSAVDDLSTKLTIEDLKSALKTCKDSTPGLDGIPYSYYKAFGNLLLPILIESWEYSIQVGILPTSQATSVISLIPKEGKNKFLIQNWRPISVSPCDLKIITKALSIKIGKHLDEIISETQMGYIPGRDINFNNRLIRTALSYCKSNNLDYIITSLDAQKAYDSVDHEYISKTLKAYGFPAEFINIVDLLHSNLIAQVQVNGFISDRFNIGRGVKQGDALSCALFIIAIDPVIRNIEANYDIQQLEINSVCRLKTFAYADDIAVICPNKNESSTLIFEEYNKLTRMSGLKLNADKTDILNLSNVGKTETISTYDGKPIFITHKDSIVICGNYICTDDQRCYEANITDKINKMETQLARWRNRNLSINGKMIIVKTFAISQLIFSSQFQAIRPKDLRHIERICYNFVWNGNDRVKRATIKLPREEGGINGIDIESFFCSVAVRQFLKSKNNKLLNSINNCSIIKEEVKTVARTILRRLLINQCKHLLDLTFEEKDWIAHTRMDFFLKPYSKAHQLSETLGINNVISCRNIMHLRGDYNKLKRSLPKAVVLTIEGSNQYVEESRCTLSIDIKGKIVNIENINNRLLNDNFKQLLKKVIEYSPTSRYGFPDLLLPNSLSTWNNLWQIKNPTLRAIRLKILYKDVWSQEKRHRLGVSSSENCVICGTTEDVLHQLFVCKNAKRFWDIYFTVIDNKNDSNQMRDFSDYLALIDVSNNLLNEIIKAAIFKMLIQIDRSSSLTDNQIKSGISYWIRIEINAINKRLRGNRSLTKIFNSAIAKLK